MAHGTSTRGMPQPETIEQAESLLSVKQTHRQEIQALIDKLNRESRISGRVIDALARLLRLRGDADNEVLRAEFWSMELKRTNPEDLPEDVYVQELMMAAEGMPEKHLAAVAGVWLQRHRMLAVPADDAARARRNRAAKRKRRGRAS